MPDKVIYDVLVYGPVFCDLVFTGLDELPTLGTEQFASDLTIAVGGSAIVAAGLHRLGLRVGLIAELGTDQFSYIIRHLLDGTGLDRTLIREHGHPLPQVTAALSFPQDRAFVTRFQRPEQSPDLEKIVKDYPAHHLHVCSFLAALETPNAVEIAHRAEMTISMDPGWDETALRDCRLHTMARTVDYFLPSQSELLFMADTDDLGQAARMFTPDNGVLVVKQGAQGATAFPYSEAPVHAAPIQVIPIDTTGAGDAFDAGFIYACIHGASLQRCLQYGVVCGGLATTALGGTSALPTLKEVETWLSKLPS